MTFIVYGSQAEQIEHPYFWKVEKDGKTSHILGTMHIAIPIAELPCSQEIQVQLEKSDLVFLEVDPHSEDFIKVEKQQEQWASSPDGREFQGLNEESQAFLRSRGISETLNLYGYNAKLVQLCHGLEGGKDIDSQVNSIADSREVPIQGLEDYYPAGHSIVEASRKGAELYSRLSDAQSAEEIRRLDHSIRMFPGICPPRSVVHMIKDYKSGSILKGAMEVVSRFSQQILQDLQRKKIQWIERFERAYQNHERIFVAANLFHFLGPVGFINMLMERGYKVESVVCTK